MILNIYQNFKIRQYAVVITVNFCVLAVGTGFLWPSPVLVKLSNSTQTVLPAPLTELEGSWIVSIGSLTGIIGNIIIAFFGNIVGRKYELILSCLPKIAASILFICATDVWMLLLGRALSGMSDNAILTLVPLYASEIASKEIRGSLGTILQIMCSIGVVIMLSMGPFISYMTLNIVFLCINALAMIPLIFLPNSPYFLFSKGQKEEALKVLIYYRGSESSAHEELKEYEAENTKQENISKKDLIRDKLFLKCVVLIVILALGSQFIGFNAVTFYLQTVLNSTQTTVMPEIASVVIGLIQLFASLGTTFMTDKFGRKPILTVTCVGMAFGMLGLGIFFKLKEGGPVVGFMNYVPLISLILVVYCYSAGLGSLFWVVGAELFNDKSRSIGMSIGLVTMTSSLFITTKYFAIIISIIGPAYTYWGFSVICILMCMFIMFCIPETKGKSFAQIQDILRNSNEKVDSISKC